MYVCMYSMCVCMYEPRLAGDVNGFSIGKITSLFIVEIGPEGTTARANRQLKATIIVEPPWGVMIESVRRINLVPTPASRLTVYVCIYYKLKPFSFYIIVYYYKEYHYGIF